MTIPKALPLILLGFALACTAPDAAAPEPVAPGTAESSSTETAIPIQPDPQRPIEETEEGGERDPSRAPALLLEAGREALAQQQSASDPNDAAATARGHRALEARAKANPEQYRFNEVSGTWLYNGWHFRQILDLHPASDLVDDAAYELTRLSMRGECEGDLGCLVERLADPSLEFLQRYPRSEYASRAVDKVLEAFGWIPEEGTSSSAVKERLRRLETIVPTLAGEAKRKAEAGIKKVRPRVR